MRPPKLAVLPVPCQMLASGTVTFTTGVMPDDLRPNGCGMPAQRKRQRILVSLMYCSSPGILQLQSCDAGCFARSKDGRAEEWMRSWRSMC